MKLFFQILFVLAIPVVAFLGVIVGKFAVKIAQKRDNKKLQEGLVQVINGEKENKIEVDGRMFNANKFIVKDDNNKEVIIEFNKLNKPVEQ